MQLDVDVSPPAISLLVDMNPNTQVYLVSLLKIYIYFAHLEVGSQVHNVFNPNLLGWGMQVNNFGQFVSDLHLLTF